MKFDYKISALSYSNTFPFVLGLKHFLGQSAENLKFEVPAISAERFRNGDVDVALIPVGALPTLNDYQIVSNFCIGANGKVKTVCLFSNYDLNEIKTIFLDSESRTSVKLVQLLAKEFWKITPDFKPFEGRLVEEEGAAFLLIGDKTFDKNLNYKSVIDLSEEWRKYTNLPFVFAVWVAKPLIAKQIEPALNQMLDFGLSHIDQIENHFELPVENSVYKEYIEQFIDFQFDEEKKQAMNLFLSKI